MLLFLFSFSSSHEYHILFWWWKWWHIQGNQCVNTVSCSVSYSLSSWPVTLCYILACVVPEHLVPGLVCSWLWIFVCTLFSFTSLECCLLIFLELISFNFCYNNINSFNLSKRYTTGSLGNSLKQQVVWSVVVVHYRSRQSPVENCVTMWSVPLKEDTQCECDFLSEQSKTTETRAGVICCLLAVSCSCLSKLSDSF